MSEPEETPTPHEETPKKRGRPKKTAAEKTANSKAAREAQEKERKEQEAERRKKQEEANRVAEELYKYRRKRDAEYIARPRRMSLHELRAEYDNLVARTKQLELRQNRMEHIIVLLTALHRHSKLVYSFVCHAEHYLREQLGDYELGKMVTDEIRHRVANEPEYYPSDPDVRLIGLETPEETPLDEAVEWEPPMPMHSIPLKFCPCDGIVRNKWGTTLDDIGRYLSIRYTGDELIAGMISHISNCMKSGEKSSAELRIYLTPIKITSLPFGCHEFLYRNKPPGMNVLPLIGEQMVDDMRARLAGDVHVADSGPQNPGE